MAMTCSSCKVPITSVKGAVQFMCPSCGKQKLVRCGHCREIAAAYTCPECNFSGPN